ncbi:hypothetical protein GS894_23890 [Rhodococcus hoagii]|nr:hypothetical protein [Prescottella equi]NKT12009.1 hypothetical protein [Prescottella equi]NKT16207.1 hypothetical protein [Prescottella equi]NKT16272.1 hypothetical protein [Prescottella equi]NKT36040.1 hypothetical protein [Prescottella equi]
MSAREVPREAIAEAAEAVAEKIDVLLERATDAVLGAPRPGSEAWQQAWAPEIPTPAAPNSHTAPGSRPQSRRPRESTRALSSSARDVLGSSPASPPQRSRSRRSRVDGQAAVTISFRCGEPPNQDE